MSNIRYAVLIIGALSLLLGLSLGQIYYQHQRIEQLEFNRFRQSAEEEGFFHDHRHSLRTHPVDRARIAAERARMAAEAARKIRDYEEHVRRYNKRLERWE